MCPWEGEFSCSFEEEWCEFWGIWGQSKVSPCSSHLLSCAFCTGDPDLGLGFSSDRPERIFPESVRQAELQEERKRNTSEKQPALDWHQKQWRTLWIYQSLQSEQEEIHGLPLRWTGSFLRLRSIALTSHVGFLLWFWRMGSRNVPKATLWFSAILRQSLMGTGLGGSVFGHPEVTWTCFWGCWSDKCKGICLRGAVGTSTWVWSFLDELQEEVERDRKGMKYQNLHLQLDSPSGICPLAS